MRPRFLFCPSSTFAEEEEDEDDAVGGGDGAEDEEADASGKGSSGGGVRLPDGRGVVVVSGTINGAGGERCFGDARDAEDAEGGRGGGRRTFVAACDGRCGRRETDGFGVAADPLFKDI